MSSFIRSASSAQSASRWEVGAITADVACEQRISANRCVRTHEEIREHPCPRSACFAISCENLACQKEGLTGYRRQLLPRLIKQAVNVFDPIVVDGEFGVDDVVDPDCSPEACGFQLRYRPIGPSWIIGNDVEKDFRVYEYHGSPRVSAMIASVSRPLPACPRSFAKRLGGCFFAAWTRTTLPSEVRRKSILLPGTIPKRSRTGLGIVICPLDVTVVVMAGPV